MSRLVILIFAVSFAAIAILSFYIYRPVSEIPSVRDEATPTLSPTPIPDPDMPQLLFNAGILTSETTGYTMRYIADMDAASARPVEIPEFIKPFAQEVLQLSPGQSHLIRHSSDGLWSAPVGDPSNWNLLIEYPQDTNSTWIPSDFHWTQQGNYVAYEVRGQDYSDFFIAPIDGDTRENIARYTFFGKDRYSRSFEGFDIEQKYIYLYEKNEQGEIALVKLAWHSDTPERIITFSPENKWVFEQPTETVYTLNETSFQQMHLSGSRSVIALTKDLEPEMIVKFTHLYSTPGHTKIMFVVSRENKDSYLMFYDLRTNSFDRFLAHEKFAGYVLSHFDPISYDDRYVMLQKDNPSGETLVREFCIVDLTTKKILSLYSCTIADTALDYNLNTDGLVFYSWVRPGSMLSLLPEATSFPEPYDWRY